MRYILTLLVFGYLQTALSAVDYNRDVRRILAANCFECHGPDEESRKGKLRLDTRDGAIKSAIVPGAPEKSEVIFRVTSTDPDEIMPPPKHHKPLQAAEIAVLKQWISEGAPYATHWAFVPPVRPAQPNTRHPVNNGIDPFIFARLEKEGLAPSPTADRYTLVRRLYLDLTGLPPTPEEADAFVNDQADDAYARLVDRLLTSPAYGERWARRWLDLARYADTNGYEKDRPRSIWPYRDWVINALNADMPYDQFSIEQLAGDMLPNASLDQRVATGFHRNTMINEEGGIDPLEYRFYAMVDRVATTGTIWMGLTTGCAQCHTHKYDPITHTDYYRMMALMNNADEPELAVTDAATQAKLQEHEKQIALREQAAINRIDRDAFYAWAHDQAATAVQWQVLEPTELSSNLPHLQHEGDGVIFAAGDFTKRDVYKLRFDTGGQPMQVAALRIEALPDARLPEGGPGRVFYEGRKGDFFLSEITLRQGETPLRFNAGSTSYGKIAVGSGKAKAENLYDGEGSTGWSTAGQSGQAHQVVLQLAEPTTVRGTFEIEMLFERHFVAGLGKFRISVSDRKGLARTWTVEAENELARGDWGAASQHAYLYHAPEMAHERQALSNLRKQRPRSPHTMVLLERPANIPRPTHRHHRGEWLKAKETVTPGIPEMFAGTADNRLAFAEWLVDKQNPLGARVAVNRAWQAFFGRGLVSTLDDFGVQAPAPEHPELLDWLAVEFMDQKWSMKQLHRLIVHSAVYQQASDHRPELSNDPHNTLLARGPRFRVEGEMVRDIMLKASGRITEKVGGPSVRPPQPASVTAIAYGNAKWPESKGPDRYRRSLYTFSKRTAPFAAYTVFDAPTGETCIAQRDRSNTPLQALTLLNDDMFLEMARALGTAAASKDDPITHIFRRLLTRPPTTEERNRIAAYYQAQLQRLSSGELKATEVCKTQAATPAQAAWTLVARVLMNLDETITKS